MDLITFKPPVNPSHGINHGRDIRLLEAEFGDGYTQAVPNGINHIRKKLDLRWLALTLEQRNQIIEFLNCHQGYKPFYYRPYSERFSLKWTCKEFESSKEDVWTVSAKFVQSFSLKE